MNEEWRLVPSFPGVFVSNLGRIRQTGGKPTYGSVHAKQRGRRYLNRPRRRLSVNVARAVCEAFHGPPPPGAVCLHLNEDPGDNRPENLRWGTQRENLNAPGFLAYCRSRTGDDNPHRKGRNRVR